MSMIVNPYRYLLAGAPTGWVAPLDGVLTSTSSGWANYTFRTFVTRPLLPGSATKVRVTFSSLSGGGINIGKAYIGLSRNNSFDIAPSQLLFSGSAGVIIPASTDVLSDELTIPFNGTGDLCVSAYISSSAGANNFLAQRSAPPLTGGTYIFNDNANSTSTIGRGGTVYGVKKIEAYTGGSWKTIYTVQTNYESGWNNYTLRSKIDVGQFSLAKTLVRFGLTARTSDFFIGKSAGGASPFDFVATPTRLTFGGANNTGTEDYLTYVTDDFDLSAFGLGTDLLFSYHATGNILGNRPSPPAGISSRYKSGNSASTVSWHSGSTTWGNYLGPAIIDEKY